MNRTVDDACVEYAQSRALPAKLLAGTGRCCGWLLLALVFVQFAVVVFRYWLGINYLWAQELALVFHAAIFMLAAGWTLLSNRHVRIDAVSEKLGAGGQKRVERIGTLLLLIPMMAVIIFTSIGYVGESWSILEGSPEVSGLPGRFLLKSLIPVFAVLMIMAGLARIFGR